MKTYFQLKRLIKLGRLEWRRYLAVQKWGKTEVMNAPKVFGNAIPKAGSHLLIQILLGLTRIGPFINPGFPPVNRFEGNTRLELNERIDEIKKMRSGEIRYGYAPSREPYLSVFLDPGMASVLIYRDPRDLLVSHVFYAKDIHTGHGMHEYYNNELKTMEERLNVAIEGCDLPGLGLPTVYDRYEEYFEWFETDSVLCLRFEDFILDLENTLGKLLDYLETFDVNFSVNRQEAIRILSGANQPKKSGTYRKAKPGNWKEYFTEENKRRFRAVAGDLLSRLGYEEDDQNW